MEDRMLFPILPTMMGVEELPKDWLLSPQSLGFETLNRFSQNPKPF